MDHIKSVLSHRHENEGVVPEQGRHDTPTAAEFDRSKAGGLTGQGSHLAGAQQPTQGASGEYHPIYDQFAKSSTAGEPIQTTDHAPHFSNSPNVPQTTSNNLGGSSAPSATSSLHPNQYRPAPHEDTSTASIKSGVIGFPQGSDDTHAARPNNNPFEQRHHEGEQAAAGGDNLASSTGDERSHVGQDVARGGGATGTGASAEHGARSQPEENQHFEEGPNHSGLYPLDADIPGESAQDESGDRPENDVTGRNKHNLQRQESDVHESGRSFPLSGGVAQQAPATIATNEREPGTKEREAGIHEGHGREALAGAAAAAAMPHSDTLQNDRHSGANLQPQSSQSANPGALAAATASSTDPNNHGRPEANPQSQVSQSNPEALAAATAATSAAYGWGSHEHGGHGHRYEGERLRSPEESNNGLLFTSGPHVTDTANRLDPHLHVPGEFPSPTPVEEPNASSYLQSKSTTGTDPSALAEPELRHTGSLEEPQSRSAEPPSQHHYGRDAAIAGGLGAAGAGAYAAGKHHQKEPTDIGQDSLYSEPNPYTSKQVDPRVDTVPRAGLAEQRYDPTAAENRSTRNAALTGGAIGSSQPSTQAPTGGRGLENKEYPAAAQDVKSDSEHHYGRDAALVGAGAATTAGLYASQRQNEPDSGPASSTIGPHKSNVANVLDPRVQPNPDLQKHHYAAPTTEDPAPSTVGPHKSDIANVLDPRVLPDPNKQKAIPKDAVQTGQVEPGVPEKDARREKHHYGHDAAVAGGAGVAGYGAYEAAKAYGEHPSTQPSASMNEQRYDPSAPGAHDPRAVASQQHSPQNQQHRYGRDAAVAGGIGAAGAGAYAATRRHGDDQQNVAPGGHGLTEQRRDPSAPMAHDPRIAGTDTQHRAAPQDQQHHYGRDAAVVGGLGAAGAGAYAATRDHGDDQRHPATGTHGLDEQRYDPTASDLRASQGQHHYGRDAALAGGAGTLGAGAYAATRGHEQAPQPSTAQAYDQTSPTQGYGQPDTAAHQRYDSTQVPEEDHTKRNAALGTAAGAGALGAGAYGLSQHEAQKEQERRLKEQQKAFDDQQKALEKQQAHDQKHHDKLVAAEEKKHQKEAEHKEREHAKEMEKKQHEHDKKLAAARAEQERRSHDGERRPSREEGTPEKKHRFLTFLNKKDKDKTNSGENSPRQSRDSPRHSKEYAAGAAGAGAAGAAAYEHEHEDGRHLGEKKGRNVLHKDPPEGHPAREADLARHAAAGKHEHVGTDGPIGNPNMVSGDHQTQAGVYGAHPTEDVAGERHTVTEPHTGLPMNTELGDGHGGTDGSRTIPGRHQAPGQTATNWDEIKKENTLY